MRAGMKERLDGNILYLYENLYTPPVFPISPLRTIMRLEKCRLLSYEELSAESGKPLADIIRACNSADGCTHYDPARDRYLMAINFSGRSEKRVRWTTAHELGHIAAGHFQELALAGRSEATPEELRQMEEEADYFAASFLAPLPAIRVLRAKSAAEVRDWFGLSQTAAELRWSEYKKNEEPDRMEEFFATHTARSSVKSARVPYLRGIDV